MTLVSPTMKRLYTRTDSYVYITKRRSYRLQRRRFMNYLEFHTSAYTDKRIGYRLQTMVVINKSLIDLRTPPKDFGIAYNEEVIH